ncbi:energy transducer TonB [Cognatiluteimonas sedimenti]|uniref:energy transducer TonB n=1 Tax=Cognatiluteimonas sedimenti TaxID=2927791 RepID=UPI0021BC976A|nr:energy transducer TonB [Lysobacter sedimenti]
MSAPSPETDPSLRPARQGAEPRPGWWPSRKALLVAAIAFAAGLLLFLLLWLDQRNNNNFYRADGIPSSAEGQRFEPLPAPLPAAEGRDNASGMGDAGPDPVDGEPPRMVEAPQAPVAPAAPPPPPAPAATIADRTVPQPLSSPAPRYPRDAQRRGETGTVLLRVHVGPDGKPYSVDLVQGSGSRALDRAASDAVRRWRFRPAVRNGEAVAGAVQVPITFNLQR